MTGMQIWCSNIDLKYKFLLISQTYMQRFWNMKGIQLNLRNSQKCEILLSSGYMVSEYLSALCENLIWVCFTSYYLVIKVFLQYLKWCSFIIVNNLSFLCVQPMTDMKIRSARKRCMRSTMHIECQIRELAFVCYCYSEI